MSRNGGGYAMPRPDTAGAVAALDGIRVAWEWLCAAPHPVTVAGTEISGVPDRPVALDELRVLALDPATGGAVRDAVWAHLVTRSRRDGPTWTVACAGMALPMLAGAYRDCVTRYPGQLTDRSGRGVLDDIASEIVTGFVAALATVDLDRPGIASALRWAALRAGVGSLREALDAPAARPHDRLVAAALASPHLSAITGADPDTADAAAARRWESSPPPARSSHPDLVLAAAVADGVLTRAEADLIGETRLQAVPLDEIAERAGHTVGAVTMRRLRAELRLIDHLLGPDAGPSGASARDVTGPGHTAARSVPAARTLPPQNLSARSSQQRPASGSGGRLVRRSSRSVTVAAEASPDPVDTGGTSTGRGAGGGDAARSPSVSGRRRRRTRGARRAQAGQVTR